MITAGLGSLLLSAEAWVEIVACRARLRLPRMLRAETFLRRELVTEPKPTDRSASRDALLAAFERALRAQPRTPGCLPRSLALRRFLTRHGHAARLALGLRKQAGVLDGHAWVEADGAIVTRDQPFVRQFLILETGARR